MNGLLDKLQHMRERNYSIFLFYLGAGLIMHVDRFILGPYALFKEHDTFDSFWPYQQALAERILSFQMPGWLPDYLGGMPILYMDINWLFLPMLVGGLLKDPWGFTAVTMMQFVIAGVGGYLFVRHFLKFDRPICLLSGLLWALGIVNLTYWRVCDLAVIPLVIYCTDRITSQPDRRGRLLLLLGLFVSAANIQFAKGAPFVAFFQLFFIFFSNPTWNRRRKVMVVYFIFWTFVVLLNLPVIFSLLSSVDVGSRSLRQWVPLHPLDGADYIVRGLRNLVLTPFTEMVMDFGFTGSLILIYGLFRFRDWHRLTKYTVYFYVAVLIYMYFIDQSVWYLTLRKHLPLVDYRLSRLHLVAPFVLLLIIATNMESFVKFINESCKKILLFSASFATLLISFHLIKCQFPQNYIEVLAVVIAAVSFMCAILILHRRNSKTMAFVVLLVLLFSAERFINMNMIRAGAARPPSFVHFFQSELFDQFRPEYKYHYRIGFINWHPSVGFYNGYQVAGGYASQYLKRYARFWESVLPGESEEFLSYRYKAYLIDNDILRESHPPHVIKKLTFNTEMLALNNVRYLFSFYRIEQPEHWGLSLVHKGISPDREPGLRRLIQALRRIPEEIPYYVYEINHCVPRVFVADHFVLVDDEVALKKYLGQTDAQALKNIVVYNKEDLNPFHIESLQSVSPAGSETEVIGEPEITHYSDNRIVINVNSERTKLLILNENYLDEWTVKINGKEASILPVYGVFRSVIISKGMNEVTFEYSPSYLTNSLWISGLGSLAIIGLVLCWILVYRKTEDKE